MNHQADINHSFSMFNKTALENMIPPEIKEMKIISLGWGVQSFTLSAMSAIGELPKVDYALHADTTHEACWTYEFADHWSGWLEALGIKVITVTAQNMRPIVDQWGGVRIPAFTTGPSGRGQIRRQCTYEWKIRPIRNWLQAHRNGKKVEQWIGISMDEFQRMRISDVKYIDNVYPLIQKRMTRQDCIAWLQAHNLEVPRKSACTFCPYKNSEEWRRTKFSDSDWGNACDVDNLIRCARPPYNLFIHPARKPLELIDLRTDQEKGQLSLWDQECSGLCGV